ncbi:hypothetical protein [Flaviaesturariibacter amylovorans]|uniref:Carboxypeptidase-like regulatory domain-containing protein n=1 Tax=Flaviaesturariibacter amylovorans TaxID=1084520 RepID=A0ABP8HIH7_9BACT
MRPASVRNCLLGSCLLLAARKASAQEAVPTRSASGVVLAKATMQPLAGASISSRKRGTIAQADPDGRFFLYTNAGDTLLVTHVGHEALQLVVPATAADGNWVAMAALPARSNLLPTVSVGQRPTPAQFGRDFLKAPVKPDSVRAAMSGLSAIDLAMLRKTTPPSGSEAVNATMRAQAEAAVHRGQIATVPGLNVFTWLKKIKRRKKK